VDPFIQAPDNSQNLNPYSYVANNPLTSIDPRGYLSTAASMWSSGTIYQNPNAIAGSVTLKNGKTIKVSYNKATGKIEDTGKTVDISDLKSVHNDVTNRTIAFQDGADKVSDSGAELSVVGLTDSGSTGKVVADAPGLASHCLQCRYWHGDSGATHGSVGTDDGQHVSDGAAGLLDERMLTELSAATTTAGLAESLATQVVPAILPPILALWPSALNDSSLKLESGNTRVLYHYSPKRILQGGMLRVDSFLTTDPSLSSDQAIQQLALPKPLGTKLYVHSFSVGPGEVRPADRGYINGNIVAPADKRIGFGIQYQNNVPLKPLGPSFPAN
jgi:hypothetical protein